MAGARIEHDERPFAPVGLNPGRRHDPDQHIVDRPLQRPAVDDQVGLEAEDVRRFAGGLPLIDVAALAQGVGDQQTALSRVYCRNSSADMNASRDEPSGADLGSVDVVIISLHFSIIYLIPLGRIAIGQRQ